MTCVNQMISIVKGEDKEIFVRLISKENHDPIVLDLNVSEIVAKFQGNGEEVHKTLSVDPGGITIVNSDTGKFKITLSELDTPKLAVGNNKSFEVVITKSGITSIVQFVSMLNVTESIESI